MAATLFFAWSTVWAGVAGSSTSNGSGASDVGPVLVLSNAHIGMTAAEIEASQSRPAPQPVPLVSDGPTDLQARADALVAVAAEARQRAVDARARADAAAAAVVAAEQAAMAGTGAAVSGLEASPAVVSLAPTNYVDCVEDSVRRGFPYADSDVACRAHFPETAP